MIENKDFNYKFDETRCATCEGNCCIGEHGYIWINKNEILALAKYLNITPEELGEKYLIKVGYRYSLKEKQLSKDNFACIFFDTIQKRCTIYEARPNQCRTFPFWDCFRDQIDKVKEECPAIID
jgi:Fe-S-cluster containining protein